MQSLIVSWEKSFNNSWQRVLLHVGFWTVYCFMMRVDSRQVHFDSGYLWLTASGVLMHLFLFYPLVYFVLPILKKRMWVKGILFFILYYVVAVIFRQTHMHAIIATYSPGEIVQYDGQFIWHWIVDSPYNPVRGIAGFLSYFTYMLSNIFIPVLLKMVRDIYRAGKQRTLLVQKNMELQLAQLRFQINPHLFFNTLNNLQSFIVHRETNQSLQLIGHMADFMRISLYELDQEQIPITREIDLIRSYIDIERIRLEENADLEVCIDNQLDKSTIPPLLLMPLIENAFKYAGKLPSNRFKVHINLCKEHDMLSCGIVNTYDTGRKILVGGIGLKNLQQRLDHYYGDAYFFSATTKDDEFHVFLKIPLR